MKLKKQIVENESLRFGSTAFWNTFLQPYRHTGAAKRGETDFLCKSLLGLNPKTAKSVCAHGKWEASRNDQAIR
jgi:hypothetical protein